MALVKNRLISVKEACGQDDGNVLFFLYLYAVVTDDLDRGIARRPNRTTPRLSTIWGSRIRRAKGWNATTLGR